MKTFFVSLDGKRRPLILWGRKEGHAGGVWIKLSEYSAAANTSRAKEGWETAVRKPGESPAA